MNRHFVQIVGPKTLLFLPHRALLIIFKTTKNEIVAWQR